MIRPLRKRVWCRQVPKKELGPKDIITLRAHDSVFWEVLEVGTQCPGVEKGDRILVEPRSTAFEAPSGRKDEAIFKHEAIMAIDSRD